MNTQLQNIINMFDALDKALNKGPLADRDEQAELRVDAENVPEKLADDTMLCGRCYDVDELFPANCDEKPERLKGQPIGQYHCPDCGAMIVAGFPHCYLCRRCIDRVHPEFDRPREKTCDEGSQA